MTEWRGGFGDSLDISEVRHELEVAAHLGPDDLLPRFRSWLYALAYGMTDGRVLVDDLAQEGYIAMWRALKTWDPARGNVTSWITTAAKLRIRDVARGHGREFGHVARRGIVTVDDHQTTSLDQLADVGVELLVTAVERLDGIVLAYHHGEIVQALAALTWDERRYVVLRFWGGLTTSEVAAALEVSTNQARWLWEAGARVKLRRSLEHLATAR